MLALAHDLLNSDYAGYRLTFVQFAQAPYFNHLNAVYNAFDFSGPLDFVKRPPVGSMALPVEVPRRVGH